MNLHEFQAKAILARYGIPVLPGEVGWTAEEAERIAAEIGGTSFAVKAQILAGGRGEAGGVRLARSTREVRDAAAGLIGSRLVTAQTSAAGRNVRRVYVERAVTCARDVYVGVSLDRDTGAIVLLGAGQGGGLIEELLRDAPEKLRRMPLSGAAVPSEDELRAFAAALGLRGGAESEAVRLMAALVRAFVDLDATLIEVNPLCVAEDGGLTALDVTMTVDDNALFRCCATMTRSMPSNSRRSATTSISSAWMATSAWLSTAPASLSPPTTSCATPAARPQTSWTSERRQ
jgi:succinyl-CoA synthetase beta subunit